MTQRRDFLKKMLAGACALAGPAAVLELVNPGKLSAEVAREPGPRWAMLVDVNKCVGCGFCVKACKRENDVPLDANVSRTWVERYVMTKDGKVYADSPNAGVDGFTSAKIDLGEAGAVGLKPEDIRKAFFVPKLCDHCDNPPCVQVCPVGATYQTDDGVVLIDRSWCIGCGYCVMACPYGCRFFHPEHHIVDKCTFCYHRITKGLQSACALACPFGARRIGNLKAPEDPVTVAVMTERVSVLKDEYGTKPQVYYLGLSKEVR